MSKGSLDLVITKHTDREGQEDHAALPVEKSAQYEEVRRTILKAYKLVLEAYCQMFRNCKKQNS